MARVSVDTDYFSLHHEKLSLLNIRLSCTKYQSCDIKKINYIITYFEPELITRVAATKLPAGGAIKHRLPKIRLCLEVRIKVEYIIGYEIL